MAEAGFEPLLWPLKTVLLNSGALFHMAIVALLFQCCFIIGLAPFWTRTAAKLPLMLFRDNNSLRKAHVIVCELTLQMGTQCFSRYFWQSHPNFEQTLYPSLNYYTYEGKNGIWEQSSPLENHHHACSMLGSWPKIYKDMKYFNILCHMSLTKIILCPYQFIDIRIVLLTYNNC